MPIVFEKATKRRARARLAFDGPAGSGKTMTALRVGRGLAGPEGKIAVIDTERGSASLYSDKIPFDVVELVTFSPDTYVEAIKAAVEAGYSVVIIDSLSHAWEGKGGALEMKDAASRRPGLNDWTAWREVTPAHNRLVDAMLQCPAHVIATMRSKMEYVQEKNNEGKTVIRKIGLAPIQRPGLEFEFTLVGDLDVAHKMLVSKTRCDLFDNALIEKPGEEFGQSLLKWLNEGAPERPVVAAVPPSTPTPAASAPPGAPASEAVAGGNGQPAATAQTFALFADRLRGGKSEADLDGVGAEIAAAVASGKVTDTERSRLIGIYTERLGALQAQAQPTQAQPGQAA